MRFAPFEKGQRSFEKRFLVWIGRRSDAVTDWDGEDTLYAEWMHHDDLPYTDEIGGKEGHNERFVDKGGEYWDRDDVYAVFTENGAFCAYVNSVDSCEEAIAYVASMIPLRLLDFAQ